MVVCGVEVLARGMQGCNVGDRRLLEGTLSGTGAGYDMPMTCHAADGDLLVSCEKMKIFSGFFRRIFYSPN